MMEGKLSLQGLFVLVCLLIFSLPTVFAQVPCTEDTDCDDGVYCNGVETCVASVCQPGTDPCDPLDCSEDDSVIWDYVVCVIDPPITYQFDFNGDEVWDTEWCLEMGETVDVEIWIDDYNLTAPLFGSNWFFMNYDATYLQLNAGNSYIYDTDNGGPWRPGFSYFADIGGGGIVFELHTGDPWGGVSPTDGKVKLAVIQLERIGTTPLPADALIGTEDGIVYPYGTTGGFMPTDAGATIYYCDDGVDCTVDSCNPDGSCQNIPDDNLCDDSVDCTDDTCDPITGCANTPNDSNCDDGVDCTDDTCNLTLDCQFTPNDANCNDGVDCTVDTCDPVEDCQFTEDDAFCNDDEFCNGEETCDLVEGCQPGTPPCELPYLCDEVNDQCVLADTIITPGDIFCTPGQANACKKPICLDNPEVLVGGMQFDLCEYDMADNPIDCMACVDCELTERTTMFDCAVLELPNGCCRVIIFCKNPGCAINPGLCDIVTIVYEMFDLSGDCPGTACITQIPENIIASNYEGYELTTAGLEGTVCPFVCGDVCPPDNALTPTWDCGDGEVDIYDVMCEVDFALTGDSPDDCQSIRADVPTGTPPDCNAPDGKIDILDIMVLIDMALHRHDCCTFYYNGVIY